MNALHHFLPLTLIATLLLSNCSKPKQYHTAQSNHYHFTNEIVENFAYADQARQFAALGNHEATLVAWDKGCEASDYEPEKIDDFKEQYVPKPAHDYIIQRAALERITMISYLKHQSFNHTFLMKLLPDLYAMGYRYFGSEALLSSINPGDCLVYTQNIDDNNPQYANLIRKAQDLGFQIFPLDYFRNRQKNNLPYLENLVSESLEKKVLLYTGLVNSTETDAYNGTTLAYQLNEKLNINPLTINLTFLSERATTAYENYYYKNIDFNQSLIFFKKDGSLFYDEYLPKWFDILVYTPRTKYIDNRPHWVANHYNQKIKIDLSKVPLDKPYFLMAVARDKCSDAIPYDMLEITPSMTQVSLFSREGPMRIIATNGQDQVEVIQKD